jgi:hypothetical protein
MGVLVLVHLSSRYAKYVGHLDAGEPEFGMHQLQYSTHLLLRWFGLYMSR